MRIAVNTRFLLPHRLEGIGWYTHEVLRRMVQQHPEDEFILIFDRPYAREFVYGANVVPVVAFPPARHPLLWYTWFEWAVPRQLKRYRPEVFFSPDGYLSLSDKTPTLLTVHDIIPLLEPQGIRWSHRQYYRYFLPRYIRQAAHIAVVSDAVRRDLVEQLSIAEERISVVYNGCREIFKPLSIDEQRAVRAAYTQGHPYFLYIGAVHPRKNIPRLIAAFEAFKRATGAPVRLVLAGRVWDGGPVAEALRRAHHRSDIHLLGYVAEQDLARLCGAALALVNVSLTEGFGLPLIEAFACDVPVLCARTPAFTEVAGEAALLVNPFATEEIAAGLIRLAREEALREALIEKERLQRRRFSWDAAARQLYALLRQIADWGQLRITK